MELDKALKARHTCRRFSTKKVNWKDILKAIEAANLSPLAGNIPTLRYILVSDSEKIKVIEQACQQSFVGRVDYIVVIVSDPTLCVRSYGERGEMYCRQQAGAAIQNLLLRITEKGLATCWVGLFVEDIVKQTLKIPEKIQVEAMFPIGYETKAKGQETKPKKRIDMDRILRFNDYKNKRMK